VIGLGWVAGRSLNVQPLSVAKTVIFILSPAVVFHSILTLELRAELLLLPLVVFVISVVALGISFWIASGIWKDAHRNILAFACSTGNTGYFGLPVAIALFGDKSAGLLILGSMGSLLFETTLGYFTIARGRHTFRESLVRAARLPAFYALVLALAGNLLGLILPAAVNDMFINARGAYSIFGSLMVGLGLSSVDRIQIDRAFMGLAFVFKFLFWPAVMTAIVFADRQWTHLLAEEAHRILLLLSVVPLAANSVAYATELRTEPGKMATTVFLSTAFALFYIPLMVAVLF
jgi:malate permease and related proteins